MSGEWSHLLPQEALEAGPLRLSYQAAADLDALITGDTDPDRLPYWTALWPSARGLCRWIVRRGGWTGVPVLELGCGLGLAGLAAAALDAELTQTDYEPGAVAAARANAVQNGVPGIRFETVDWRSWDLPGQWPVVLGSDLAYERASHVPLLRVLDRVLAPGGAAYLADPDRPMSAPFFGLARREGWDVSREPAPAAGDEPPIFVYTLQRRGLSRPNLPDRPRREEHRPEPGA